MPRGSGCRDVLLQTTACLTQGTGLFAFRLQGDMEEPHGHPKENVLLTHSLLTHRR